MLCLLLAVLCPLNVRVSCSVVIPASSAHFLLEMKAVALYYLHSILLLFSNLFCQCSIFSIMIPIRFSAATT